MGLADKDFRITIIITIKDFEEKMECNGWTDGWSQQRKRNCNKEPHENFKSKTHIIKNKKLLICFEFQIETFQTKYKDK